ncbi:hypothetical protein V8G54_015946, partial [Vigna mungo]
KKSDSDKWGLQSNLCSNKKKVCIATTAIPRHRIRQKQNSTHNSPSFIASTACTPQHITLNPPAYLVMSGVKSLKQKKSCNNATHTEDTKARKPSTTHSGVVQN